MTQQLQALLEANPDDEKLTDEERDYRRLKNKRQLIGLYAWLIEAS